MLINRLPDLSTLTETQLNEEVELFVKDMVGITYLWLFLALKVTVILKNLKN